MRIFLCCLLGVAIVACGDEGDSGDTPVDLVRDSANGGHSNSGEGIGTGSGEPPFCSVTLSDDDTYSVDTCNGDDICIEGSCESAVARRYEFLVLGFSFSPEVSWDALSNNPDGFVTLTLDGQYLGRTLQIPDKYGWSYIASEQGVGVGTVVAGSRLEMQLWDEDVSDDDMGIGCSIDLSPNKLRRRTFMCIDENDSQTYLYVAYRPQATGGNM